MLAVHLRSSAGTSNVPLPIFLLSFSKYPHKGRETGHFYCYMSFYLESHCCLPVRPEHLGSTEKIKSLGVFFKSILKIHILDHRERLGKCIEKHKSYGQNINNGRII